MCWGNELWFRGIPKHPPLVSQNHTGCTKWHLLRFLIKWTYLAVAHVIGLFWHTFQTSNTLTLPMSEMGIHTGPSSQAWKYSHYASLEVRKWKSCQVDNLSVLCFHYLSFLWNVRAVLRCVAPVLYLPLFDNFLEEGRTWLNWTTLGTLHIFFLYIIYLYIYICMCVCVCVCV